MNYQVDGWNNFCRVFECPEKYSSEFCFGPGIPTLFTMVDWFCPVDGLPNPTCSKEVWKENVGKIDAKVIDHEECFKNLSEFLKGKVFVKPNRDYLVICNFGMAFIFKKP
jgi:hypothetical protein